MSGRAAPARTGATGLPSKLLEECGVCGRPIFWCRMEALRRRVAVEVLETRRGDVAIQTQLGSDELAAVVVGSGTFYQLHHAQGRCIPRPFSRAPGAAKRAFTAGKVR